MDPTSTSLLGVVIQFGSLGILGYYILFVHPKIMREQQETLIKVTDTLHQNAKEDREQFNIRNDAVAKKIDGIIEAMNKSMLVRAENVQITTKIPDSSSNR